MQVFNEEKPNTIFEPIEEYEYEEAGIIEPNPSATNNHSEGK